MGGGTTLVEGSRLGMNLFGCDLNPVAWFVVKGEVTLVDVNEVKQLLAEIEADVKPFLMPYFTCDGPEGEKGVWFNKSASTNGGWMKLPADFDIWSVSWQDRSQYRYEGPEIIYTLWAKHGPCEARGCGHRTPLLSTPIVAVKTLTVKGWSDYECSCGGQFDVEQFGTRIAPEASLVLAPDEKSFAAMNGRGEFTCPHCAKVHTDLAGRMRGDSVSLGGKASNKKVDLTLLMHPDWLKGCGANDPEGNPLGGSATDDVEATVRWYRERAKTIRLVEVRGLLPETVTCPRSGTTFSTGKAGGNIPKRSTFNCQHSTCGRQQDVLESIKKTGKNGPKSPYVIQAYSPKRDDDGFPYSGRYFAAAHDTKRYENAAREWDIRSGDDLAEFWPRSELPYGFMTHMNNGGIPSHGYTHWWKMFNPLQLLTHTQLLKCILSKKDKYSEQVIEAVLGVFQQYLRNQNQFTIWNIQADQMEPMFSNNNFHPKACSVENNVFNILGRGNWQSCAQGLVEAVIWQRNTTELVSKRMLVADGNECASGIAGKSVLAHPEDPILDGIELSCRSSTDLNNYATGTADLFITDPHSVAYCTIQSCRIFSMFGFVLH